MAGIQRYIICTISIGLLLFAASCHEAGPPNESPAADSASAADEITQADQLCGQRDDLIQLRRGIVARLDQGYQNGSAYMVRGLVYLNAITRSGQ